VEHQDASHENVVHSRPTHDPPSFAVKVKCEASWRMECRTSISERGWRELPECGIFAFP
jgi:hypothetical protein